MRCKIFFFIFFDKDIITSEHENRYCEYNTDTIVSSEDGAWMKNITIALPAKGLICINGASTIEEDSTCRHLESVE